MYIYSLKCILPDFTGSDSNNYGSSLYWFLQKMTKLHPSIPNKLQRRLFVVRGTNTFWSGVSPNLFIEQTLIASFLGSSGLTRGRSLTDLSRLIKLFVLSIDMNEDFDHLSNKTTSNKRVLLDFGTMQTI